MDTITLPPAGADRGPHTSIAGPRTQQRTGGGPPIISMPILRSLRP